VAPRLATQIEKVKFQAYGASLETGKSPFFTGKSTGWWVET